MPEINLEQFDGYEYLDQLIEELGLKDADETKLAALKKSMFEDLRRRLFQAASENVEPEVIDVVMREMQDETDAGLILQELIQTSPGAQLALLTALEDFRTFTLNVFNNRET